MCRRQCTRKGDTQRRPPDGLFSELAWPYCLALLAEEHPTKEHPTHATCTLAFAGPVDHAEAAREALHALGFVEADTRNTVPWREAFPPIPDAELPGRMLRAARSK